MDTKVLKELLKEMALHIDQGQDACAFSNMCLELLRGEVQVEDVIDGPLDGETVDTVSLLVNGKGWSETLVKLDLYVDPESKKILQRQEAEAFIRTSIRWFLMPSVSLVIQISMTVKAKNGSHLRTEI